MAIQNNLHCQREAFKHLSKYWRIKVRALKIYKGHMAAK